MFSFCPVRAEQTFSLSPLIFSFSNTTLPVPKDRPGYWLALGNDTTCRIQGALMVFSFISTPLYNLALCIYFLCVIRYNMTDERFGQLWEPYLHALPILYAIGAATYTLAAGYINPTTTMCWISSASNPLESKNSPPRVEYIIIGGPIFVIFILIIFIMLSILWTVRKQERTMERYRFQLSSGLQSRRSIRSEQNASRTRRRVKAAESRAILFSAAYIITYAPTLISRILSSTLAFQNVPFFFVAAARFFLPLQGVLNMFVHLHPQVKNIQREHPQYWYIRALGTALINLDSELDSRRGRGVIATRRRSRHLRDTVSALPASPRRSSTRWSMGSFRLQDERMRLSMLFRRNSMS